MTSPALLYVLALLGPASSLITPPDLFLKCFTQEDSKVISCSNGRSCPDTLIFRTQNTNFRCLMPDDVNDLRINYAKYSCYGYYQLNVTQFDGSISCPGKGSNKACVRFLQIISGCYSYNLVYPLQYQQSCHVEDEVESEGKCPKNTQAALCSSSVRAGAEYRVVELQNHGQRDGARLLLPLRNNGPIDCSRLGDATAPPSGLGSSKTPPCNTHGGPRKGPCSLLNSEIPRTELTTLPLRNGVCPNGYCPRSCSCIAAGSILETDDCHPKLTPKPCFGLFDVPEKPTYKPKGSK